MRDLIRLILYIGIILISIIGFIQGITWLGNLSNDIYSPKQEIYDKVAVSYMKKAMYGIWGIVLAAGLLSGCNSDIPDLTEEESALITEYATNLLVKHSELYDRNLLSASEL